MDIGQIISDVMLQVYTFVIEIIHPILPMEFLMSSEAVIAELQKATWETLQMTIVPSLLSLPLGLAFGILFTVCRPGGLYENKFVTFVADKVVNFFRSVPFVILISLLGPLSMTIMGTKIGVIGMYTVLVFGVAPFFGRQFESSFSEVDKGLIEASIAMGDSKLQTIYRVYLKESIPSIARATAITYISIIGLSAMAGMVAGGGLGNFAIRYGYQRQEVDATWASIVIILIIVSIIQGVASLIAKKTTH